ncbi:hypothetical protein [Methylobacterium gnaphalii]|uniref:Uncharacterized protein n=1 Tax=Methylobacterium gnaphalii TaxID=1010610 RepID=A0A512JID8_9HYPH|nr:hypothetical protein [Methylobacterium gnaphalii]GEP09720.1 hypothetical protein MGN01_15650 [Methylobacterium gnaphalii]GJD70806.1 hypothetical protein MMMDOFMJ_3759 [Methylobacterium gnaphalii]GLS50137.1 hypothetical protein GCM10007885_29890 [Methylobacterium gnaphalii]
MTRTVCLATLLIALAAPATASPCLNEIDALSGKVQEQSKQAISANSAGQHEAAARGGQGKTGASGEASAVPPEKSTDAGKGADKAQAAKIALDEARTAQGKGDEKGCMDAVGRAKTNLDGAH